MEGREREGERGDVQGEEEEEEEGKRDGIIKHDSSPFSLSYGCVGQAVVPATEDETNTHM